MTVIDLPGPNHNVQTAKSGRSFGWLIHEETAAPLALATLAKWVSDVACRTACRAISGARARLHKTPVAQRHCSAKNAATWFSSCGKKAMRSKPGGLDAASPAADGRGMLD